MMSFIIGLLTVVLVLDSLILILLILIQLPKKEAGAGIAFGGGATDALFGAGSGTALTKITKYSTTLFLGLSLLLSTVNARRASAGNRNLEEELRKRAAAAPASTSSLVPTNIMATGTSAPIVMTPPAASRELSNVAPGAGTPTNGK